MLRIATFEHSPALPVLGTRTQRANDPVRVCEKVASSEKGRSLKDCDPYFIGATLRWKL